MTHNHSPEQISEIIDMAWCDKTSFDDIKKITGIAEQQVINIMRLNLKPSSFRLWRKRVSGRKAKHSVKLDLVQNSVHDDDNIE
jgi:uncharacterized protein (TIGR03643 family)